MASDKKLLELMKDRFEENEEMVCYVQGAFQATIRNKNTIRTGILVATNKKVRFCGKRFFLVYDDEIEYSDIYNVEVTDEKLGHTIFIHGKKKSYFMRFVVSDELDKFAKVLKNFKGKRRL